MGVCNMLCLTGDGVQAGDHPQAKPVFDLDCMSLLEIAACFATNTGSRAGAGSPPAARVVWRRGKPALPHAWRAQRLAKKVAAGAQFFQTQYCFDIPLLREFLDHCEQLGVLGQVFLLIGVGPLRSAKSAEWMRKHVPGIHVPDHIINRLAGATDQAREGREICIEQIQELREMRGISGVHVMAYRQEESVAEVIDRSGVLNGRVPWFPQRATQPIANRIET